MSDQFNPLDKMNLAKSVAQALLESPLQALARVKQFEGPGIYAIYYSGSFEVYAAYVRGPDGNPIERPIYVGKAVPAGRRKGRANAKAKDYSLSSRIAEHAESVKATENLDIADFKYRALVVDPLFIPLGEGLMIAKFSPLWNQYLDGFGNHDPGAGRYNGERPRWDVLHPGRPWAAKCKERQENAYQITKEIGAFLAGETVPGRKKKIEIDLDDVLNGSDSSPP